MQLSTIMRCQLETAQLSYQSIRSGFRQQAIACKTKKSRVIESKNVVVVLHFSSFEDVFYQKVAGVQNVSFWFSVRFEQIS